MFVLVCTYVYTTTVWAILGLYGLYWSYTGYIGAIWAVLGLYCYLHPGFQTAYADNLHFSFEPIEGVT